MVCRPLMGRPSLLSRMFPSLGSQTALLRSRRRLGGSSVPLFSRLSSRELVYCTRELPARPVRSPIPTLARPHPHSARPPRGLGHPSPAVGRPVAINLSTHSAVAAAGADAAAGGTLRPRLDRKEEVALLPHVASWA